MLRLYVLVLMEYHGVYRNNNGNKNTKVNIPNYYSVNTYRVFESD